MAKTFVAHCIFVLYLLRYLVFYNVKLHVIVVTLAVCSLPSSSVIWLAGVSKFSAPFPLHVPTQSVLKTARRKENSEAAKLTDFGSCVLGNA